MQLIASGRGKVRFLLFQGSDSSYITHNPGQTSGTGTFGEHRRGSTVWCCWFVCLVFNLEKEYKFQWVVMGEGSEKRWGMKKIYGQNVLYGHIIVKKYNNKKK